jgi:hypothetical protein
MAYLEVDDDYDDRETKLVLLSNVIPLDFNAPVSAFHNSVRKKKVFFFLLVASLANF